jgi:hypothetical protein
MTEFMHFNSRAIILDNSNDLINRIPAHKIIFDFPVVVLLLDSIHRSLQSIDLYDLIPLAGNHGTHQDSTSRPHPTHAWHDHHDQIRHAEYTDEHPSTTQTGEEDTAQLGPNSTIQSQQRQWSKQFKPCIITKAEVPRHQRKL